MTWYCEVCKAPLRHDWMECFVCTGCGHYMSIPRWRDDEDEERAEAS